MKSAQLIHVEEKVLYLKDGIVISEPTKDNDKLLHALFGETKIMKTESVVEHLFFKNKKDADVLFWNYMNQYNLDFREYYLVFN